MNIDILSNLVITKVHSISTMYTPWGARSKRINRPCWAIVMKHEGETIYESDGKRFLSDLSHIAILPKGCTYTWECTRAGRFSIIDFECDSIFPEPIIMHTKHSDKILRMLKELEYKRNLDARMLGAESIRDTYSVILSLVSPSFDKYLPNSKRRMIRKAIEYISQNPGIRITNDALAAMSGLSTVYFRKLFREVTGTSPIAYAKQLRIEKAKEMLGTDYGTLSDIAHSLGYSGLYDFSRDFKKHVGLAPSKYTMQLHKE